MNMRETHTVIIKVNIKSINARKIALYNNDRYSFFYETFSFKVLHENGYIVEQVQMDIDEALDDNILNLFTNNTIDDAISFMAEKDIRPYDEYYICCDWTMMSNHSYYDGNDYDFEVDNIKIIRTDRKTLTD
jgi:hypothetical protein